MFDVTCLDKYGNTVTNLTQWDLNQTLYIEDHGFTTPPQFHFCNKNSEKALVVQSEINGDMLEVIVPNILLVEPYTITAYVYLSEDDSSKTVEYVQIPVRQRPQPDAFEYEDNVVIIDVQELANEMRALNESMRSAEEERVTAETIRITNEEERQSAEANRKASETIRINAETERVSAESVRKENETTRVENEDTRKSSEQSRINAESERVNAENIRKENETNRFSAETERIDSENERLESETNRANAEAERIENENERINAESIRVAAENERISAEAVRQTQEETRQANTTTAVANAELATERANVAAEACEGIIEGTGLIPVTEKGYANGVATLDENALIPISQLPEIDAKTLDGHGAEYFATAEELQQIDGTTVLNTSILEKALTLDVGFHIFKFGRGAYTENDLPANNYKYGHAEVQVIEKSSWIMVFLYGVPNVDDAKRIAFNRYNGTEWSGWDEYATTADLTAELTNYFKNTGGNIYGDVAFTATDATNRYQYLKNTLRVIYNAVTSNGAYTLYDHTNNKEIIKSTADGTTTFNGTATGNLPLTGGTVEGTFIQAKTENDYVTRRLKNPTRSIFERVAPNGQYCVYDETNSKYILESSANGTSVFYGTAQGNLPLDGGGVVSADKSIPVALKNNSADSTYLQYVGKNGSLGYVGFLNANRLVYMNSASSEVKDILHTGNMASHVLPLDGGGTVSAEKYDPIAVNNTITNASGVYVKYALAGITQGQLGFIGLNKPGFYSTDGSGSKELHHDGNSAKVHIGTTAPNDTTGNVLFINTSA